MGLEHVLSDVSYYRDKFLVAIESITKISSHFDGDDEGGGISSYYTSTIRYSMLGGHFLLYPFIMLGIGVTILEPHLGLPINFHKCT